MTHRAALPIDHASDGIVVEKRRAAGVVVLARRQKRNALGVAMRQALATAYPDFARDPVIYGAVLRSADPGVFSAGLDLDEIGELCRRDREVVDAAIADALRLCWLQECFTKPTVALMDGIVLAGGFGIGLHGTHRVAGENYAFACPETGLGLIPAGGICLGLARMPGCIGTYLALTGKRIGRADAFHLGLVTHCLPADRFGEVEARLVDADPVDAVLDALHGDPGRRDLADLEAVIERCFSAPTVAEILERLDRESGAHATWARETAIDLRRHSPLALEVTRRLLAEAAAFDLRGLLMLEHRVLCRLMAGPDVRAGLPAARIPTQRPVWEPATIGEVAPAMVSEVLTRSAGAGLILPTRPRMQARTAASGGTE